MCVAIPRKIIEISDAQNNLAMIDVNGVKKQVNIALIVDANHPAESCVGDWALINMGLAMGRVSKKEAARTLELLRELAAVQLQMDNATRLE
jgi:hydrogenase expression/formation protein HypC